MEERTGTDPFDKRHEPSVGPPAETAEKPVSADASTSHGHHLQRRLSALSQSASEESDPEAIESPDDDHFPPTIYFQSGPAFVPRYPVSATPLGTQLSSQYVQPQNWRNLPLQKWQGSSEISQDAQSDGLGRTQSATSHKHASSAPKQPSDKGRKSKKQVTKTVPHPPKPSISATTNSEEEEVERVVKKAEENDAQVTIRNLEGAEQEGTLDDEEPVMPEAAEHRETSEEQKGRSGHPQPQLLIFHDAVGRKFKFPFAAVKTWQVGRLKHFCVDQCSKFSQVLICAAMKDYTISLRNP